MLRNNFSKLCRCCMKNGEFNIFSTLFDSLPIAILLQQLFIEHISSEDQLPKTICDQCLNVVISQFLFLKNYQRVQVLLHQILEKNVSDEEQNISHLSDNNHLSIINNCNSDYVDPPSSLLSKRQGNCNKEGAVPSAVNNCELNHNESQLKNEIRSVRSPNYELSNISSPIDEINEVYPSDADIKKTKTENISSKEFANPSEELHHKDHKLIEEINFISSEECVNSLPDTIIYSHTCKDCNESFKFIKQLRTHCRDTGHFFPRRYCCEICSKKFSSNTILKDHMRIHNKEKPLLECNECGLTFSYSSSFSRHKKIHSRRQPYICEICGKGLTQKYSLIIHMRIHNGEKPYECDLCGQRFRRKQSLLCHLDEHHGIGTKGITYGRQKYIKYGRTKVECRVCRKVLTKSALYTHMKVVHGDTTNKFLCNLCGKTLATKSSLEKHMLIHSGERPHRCDICDKTFTQHAHLVTHMKTHNGAKPHCCTFCKKRFALKGNLKVHIRTHTGETPHQCAICSKGFVDTSSKKKHEATVHQLHPQKKR